MALKILVGQNSSGKTLQAYNEINKDRENTISNIDEPDEITLESSVIDKVSDIIENRLGYRLVITPDKKDFSISDTNETMSNNLKQVIKILCSTRKYKVLDEPEKQLKNSDIQILCEILFGIQDNINAFMITHSDELIIPDATYTTISDFGITEINMDEAEKICEGWI